MRVRATRQGDVWVPGEPKARALFDGQTYDLPDEVVSQYDWLEPVERKPQEPEPSPEPDEAEERPARRRRRGS